MERTPKLGLPLPYVGSVSLRTALRIGFERINEAFGLDLPTVSSGHISPRTLIRRNFRVLNDALALTLPLPERTAGVVIPLQTVREAFKRIDDAYSPVIGYRIEPTSADLIPGGTQQLKLFEITDEGETDITAGAGWTSSAPSIATVSANGQVTAASEGVATISAKGEAAEITVTNPIVGYRIEPTSLLLTEGETGQVALYAIRADGSEQNVSQGANWDSDTPEVVTVGPDGLVTAVATGEAHVTAEGQSCEVIVNPAE